MHRLTRTMMAVLGLAAAATPALAQVPGMPLFTNPRYGTGLRIHADYGKPDIDDPNGDLSVIQAGVTFALGPVGLGANLGMTRASLDNTQTCNTNPTMACLDTRATLSALAQLRVAGGGTSSLSLSVFGGASMDLDTAEAKAGTVGDNKRINIPLGVAIGMRVPVGPIGVSLWGAPRYNITRYANCTGTCVNPDPAFGWAVGADIPLFRIISVRAAYDVQKTDGGPDFKTMGIGVSLGIGGMR